MRKVTKITISLLTFSLFLYGCSKKDEASKTQKITVNASEEKADQAIEAYKEDILKAGHEPLSESEISNITSVVEKYAASISCLADDENEKLIREIRAIKPSRKISDSDGEYIEGAKYVVAWIGNIHCEGNGSNSFEFAIVNLMPNGEFKVSPPHSTPSIEVAFPQSTFSKIVKVEGDIIVIEAYEYGQDDARCCPSIKVHYTLNIDKDGGWQLKSKTPVI